MYKFMSICTRDKIWYTTYTNLTDFEISTGFICFQHTWALWIPCFVLSIFAASSIACTRKKVKDCDPVPWKSLIIFKLMIVTTLVILGIIKTSMCFVASKQWNIGAISAAISSVTWGILLCLMVMCRFRGNASSGIIFAAWTSLAILSSIRLWVDFVALQAGLMHFNFIFVLSVVCSIFVILEAVLHCWADQIRIQDDRVWPELNVSFLNRTAFHWMTSLVWTGMKRPLEQSDLWELDLQRRAEFITRKWEGFWVPAFDRYVRMQPLSATWKEDSGGIEYRNIVTKQRKPSVLYRLLLCTKKFWLPAILCKFVADILLFLYPFLLKKLIEFVRLNVEQRSLTIGILYALSLFGTAAVITALNNRFYYGAFSTAMLWQSILTTAIYKKVFRISNSERKSWEVGKITNVMSIDVSKLTDAVNQCLSVLSTPAVISISIYQLWWELGPSLFAGVLTMVLFLLLSGFISSRIKNAQINQMREKDSRMKLTSELIENVKVLKLYAWEDYFQKRVLEFRSRESKTLRHTAVWQGLSSALFQTVPFLIAAVTFTAYVLSHGQGYLTAEKAFVSLALFNILRGPMLTLSSTVSRAMQVSVSYKRVKDFLCAEELQDTSANCPQPPLADQDEFSIQLKRASFSWDTADETAAALTTVDLRVRKRSLVAVTGPVGSGKSSLINAISGDLTLLSGIFDVRGSLGVVHQTAWIQNRTIRDNILFGAPYDEIIYNKVVDVCALRDDIDRMPAGDLTEVGERGVTLSGGQNQRLALARAVYQDTDVYLFDDPLSALDANVAQHIFTNVISNIGVLSKKTRLFVTHQRQFLNQCDEIIVVRNGQVFTDDHRDYVKADDEAVESEQDMEMDHPSDAEDSPLLSGSSMHSGVGIYDDHADVKQGTLVEQETARAGTTPWYIYKSCALAVGPTSTFLLLSCFLAAEAFGVGGNIWLKHWVDGNKRTNFSAEGAALRLEVYLVFGSFQGICYFLAAFLTAAASVRVASTFHSRLLRHLLRCPLQFFEKTPAGQIINRLSMDLDVVDYSMPLSLRIFLQSFIGLLGVLVVVSITTPWFLIVTFIMGTGYIFFQRCSMHASRQLKRMEATTRTPVYIHFVEAVHGYQCIRCFGAVDRFVSDCYSRVDAASRAYYVSTCFTRWLASRLEVLSGLVVFFSSLFVVLSRTVSPGSAALSITYAIGTNTLLSQVMRYAAWMENIMVAIERIFDYSTGEEEAWSSQQSKDTCPANWPKTGTVQFKNYHMSYQSNSRAALKDINLFIADSEKLGIVGRTGAGKSSLLLAMLRIVEPSQGTVFIDNVDVQMIELKVLRSRITVIPQDAVIFSGTLRMNLDPAEEYTDAEIWSALAQSALADYIASKPEKLSFMMSAGGSEISVGQKHLLCLARALLRKSKILLLDEATAAVDDKTDAFILKAVRERFASSTVITVAHRLSTVMDSSRVLVMADGGVQECGTLEKFRSDPKSAFYNMCKHEKTV